MIAYILNSTLCLLALYIIYRVFLANETCYRFNRIYLLAAIILGLSLPSLDFFTGSYQFIYRPGDDIAGVDVQAITEFKKAPASFVTGHLFPTQDSQAIAPDQTPSNWGMPAASLLTIGYSLITLFLLSRYIFSLYSIHKRKKGSEYIQLEKSNIRLVNSKIAPHTFMDDIFVYKKDYENGLITDGILIHQIAHISGKHTLDRLFVGFVKAILWFNPGIYPLSRAMRINHQYKADAEALKKVEDVQDYQHQLDEAAGNRTEVNLASCLNFYSTNKRLFMMDKKTSFAIGSLKMGLMTFMVPLLIILFSTRVIDKDNLQGIYEIKLVPDTVVVDDSYSYVQWKNEDGTLFDGSNKFFDPRTGILREESIYENGIKVTQKTYTGLGEVFYQTNVEMEDGIPIYRKTYMSGSLFSELIYPTPDREYEGIQRYLYANGGLKFEAHFLKDSQNLHGTVTEFNEQGAIVEQEQYDDGRLVAKIK